MLGCQSVQNIGLSNRKLKSALVHAPYDHNARPSQTDGQTDRRTNIMAIVQRFVLRTHRALKTDNRLSNSNENSSQTKITLHNSNVT